MSQTDLVKKEIIFNIDFSDEVGDFWSLVGVLANPSLSLKMISIAGEDAKNKATIVMKALTYLNRRDIPIAVNRSYQSPSTSTHPFVTDFKADKYPGLIYYSMEVGYGEILPSMERPFVFSTGDLSNLIGVRSLLSRHDASIILLSPAFLDSCPSGFSKEYRSLIAELGVAKSQTTLIPLSSVDNFKFNEKDLNVIRKSKSPFAKLLYAYYLCARKEKEQNLPLPRLLAHLAASFYLTYPQNFELGQHSVPLDEEDRRMKAFGQKDLSAKTIHKSRAMIEMFLHDVTDRPGTAKELQIVGDQKYYRIAYPSLFPSRELSVTEVGHEKHRPRDFYGPTERDYYILHLLVGGKGMFKIGDKESQLQKGDCFLVPPLVTTYFEADAVDPYDYYWVGFNGTEAKRIVESCGFSFENGFTLHIPNYERVRDQLRIMAASDGRERGTAYWLLGHLYSLLSYLIIPDMPNEKVDYVDKALEYISANYCSTISVKDVCEYVSVERTYFFRIFKKRLGVSPQEYLINLRIEKAKELLKTTDKPISTIAYMIGYLNYVSFLNVFQSREGMAPTEYRIRNAIEHTAT